MSRSLCGIYNFITQFNCSPVVKTKKRKFILPNFQYFTPILILTTHAITYCLLDNQNINFGNQIKALKLNSY